MQIDAPEGYWKLYEFTISIFSAFLQKFPWATHIGKLDTDTFPYVNRLVGRVPEGRYSIVGQIYDFHGCGGPYYSPPPDCGLPVDNNFMKYRVERATRRDASTDEPCWSYPQGGLYLISR